MILIERHLIHSNHKCFNKLINYCVNSKKLYNSLNYQQRANYLTLQNDVMSFGELDKLAKTIDTKQFYYDMPNTKVAQQTVKLLCEDWTNYFKALHSYTCNHKKFKGTPKPPKYKTNKLGYLLHFTNQASNIKTVNYI